jgi:hypothetical protein
MLPQEIRDRIYYEVLGGENLRICRYPGKITAEWGIDDSILEDQSSREGQSEAAINKRLNVVLTCRKV